MGNFSYWIEKLRDHYLRKTGMHFFPGTLNIELDEPWSVPADPCGLKPGSTAAPCRSTSLPARSTAGPGSSCAQTPMNGAAAIILRRSSKWHAT